MQKSLYKEFFRILFISITFFLILDLLIGNYIYKKILRKNFFDVDTNMGKKDPIFHHGLKKNYKTYSAGWGTKKFSFCTDENSFRSSCDRQQSGKYFNIGIIGDSFTVGFGLDYKDMFVSKIENKLKNLTIANLSASSYAPSIYFSKINFLIQNNYKFDEIIVFLDLSDLQDDVVRYGLDEKNNIIFDKDNNDWTPRNYSTKEKILNVLSKRFKVTNHIITKTNLFLINKNIIKKKIPDWVLTTPRSSWTYKYEKKWFDNKSLDESISILIHNMDKLYLLLKEHNIKLSIAVYPWPSTIFFDEKNNLQVKIWEEYCKKKCKKFYNLMEPFFEIKEAIGPRELYFKYYIDGDIHFNENGNSIIAENFLKNY